MSGECNSDRIGEKLVLERVKYGREDGSPRFIWWDDEEARQFQDVPTEGTYDTIMIYTENAIKRVLETARLAGVRYNVNSTVAPFFVQYAIDKDGEWEWIVWVEGGEDRNFAEQVEFQVKETMRLCGEDEFFITVITEW
jgi:hypothetical protein